MLVIASVNVDVQEAALVEVRAPRSTCVQFINAINQVDQRGFKVLAYCNELDSANEQHQWREVSPPLSPWHRAAIQTLFAQWV